MSTPDPTHSRELAPQRDEAGRLRPGHTANRKGRPRTGMAFAEAVRDHVDPVEVIAFVLTVMRGEPTVHDLVYIRECARCEREGLPPPVLEGLAVHWPTVNERLGAATFLADRGWQKPVQQTALEVSQGTPPALLDYTRLSQAELDALEALHAKAAGVVTVAQAAGALEVGRDEER